MKPIDREHAGLHIATRIKLRQEGALWFVPSQSTDRIYRVDPDMGVCSCADYGTRKIKCKHLWAVDFTIKQENGSSYEVIQDSQPYDYQAETARALRAMDAGKGDLPF